MSSLRQPNALRTRARGHEHLLQEPRGTIRKHGKSSQKSGLRGPCKQCKIFARCRDAVSIESKGNESKARDFFDAKDPDVQINCAIVAMATDVLQMLDRIQEKARRWLVYVSSRQGNARTSMRKQIRDVCGSTRIALSPTPSYREQTSA